MIKPRGEFAADGGDVDLRRRLGLDYGREPAAVLVMLQIEEAANAIDEDDEVAGGIRYHSCRNRPGNGHNDRSSGKWLGRTEIAGGAIAHGGRDSFDLGYPESTATSIVDNAPDHGQETIVHKGIG